MNTFLWQITFLKKRLQLLKSSLLSRDFASLQYIKQNKKQQPLPSSVLLLSVLWEGNPLPGVQSVAVTHLPVNNSRRLCVFHSAPLGNKRHSFVFMCLLAQKYLSKPFWHFVIRRSPSHLLQQAFGWWMGIFGIIHSVGSLRDVNIKQDAGCPRRSLWSSSQTRSDGSSHVSTSEGISGRRKEAEPSFI